MSGTEEQKQEKITEEEDIRAKQSGEGGKQWPKNRRGIMSKKEKNKEKKEAMEEKGGASART